MSGEWGVEVRSQTWEGRGEHGTCLAHSMSHRNWLCGSGGLGAPGPEAMSILSEFLQGSGNP